MRDVRASLAWAAIAASMASCADAFTCVDDISCGDGGRCEPTGFCSFVDDDCPAGRRYGEHASASLAGTCVEEPIAEGTGTTIDVGSTMTTSMAVTTQDETSGDPATGAVSVTSSATDATLTSDVTSDVSSDFGSSSDDSTGGGQRIEIGPLLVEDDFDDGAMWPDAQVPGAWLPSGESEPGHAFMGEYPTGSAYYGYFRFRLPIALPAGTIITAAHFEVGGLGDYLWNPRSDALRIWIERSTDAAQVSSLDAYPETANVVAAQLGNESVRWPEVGGLSWNVLETNASPQLVLPFQELLEGDDLGLAEGAHVQLWIGADDLGNGNREVAWVDRSGASDNVGRLWLEVELP